MRKPIVYLLMALSAPFAAGHVYAQAASSVAPDNSKSNQTDPTNSTSTADAQANSASDFKLTKRIRQTLIADKSLSTYAHNIKIVSANGNVTLNGVVRTEEERNAVEAKAQNVAGKDHVTNALKIAPSKP